MRGLVAVVAAGLCLCACAKSADSVTASYVSPLTYQNYDCQQLAAEAQRVSAKARELAGVQDSKAVGDAVATTVGVVVFWPALFLIKGNEGSAQELANLKGQAEAIEQASIQKKCAITFQKSSVQS